MPNAYTAPVLDGTVTDFADFALRCARAFGATGVDMRDEPADVPPRRTSGSAQQDAERLELARKNLAEYEQMTVDEATKIIERRRADEIGHARAEVERYTVEKS